MENWSCKLEGDQREKQEEEKEETEETMEFLIWRESRGSKG